MASRAARAARIKAKKEKHKARKATTARLNPRRRGRPLYERESDAAASALLVQVGEELSDACSHALTTAGSPAPRA